VSTPVHRGGRARPDRKVCSLVALPIVMGMLLALTGGRTAAATVRSLPSAVSTASDSWVVLPMGELSVENNTFWQVLHSAPGSSQWSAVTPEGVADNGGLVAGAAAGTLLIGFLPSQLLRYSPLALSADGGGTWSPQLLPAALRALPDGLAYGGTGPAGALAVTGSGTVLAAPRGLSPWSTLVTTAHLRRISRSCGVTSVDAVALLPSGSPLIATGCRRGGDVGIFTRAAGSWRSVGTSLTDQPRSATDVLRLDASGATVTALVSTSRGRDRTLVALRKANEAWSQSPPLVLSTRTSVLATAVGEDGALAVLLGSPRSGTGVFMIDAGGLWARLPQPPAGTTAIALPSGLATVVGDAVDAFTVHGGSLGVFALTASNTRWVRIQSSHIALAYGSSS
jgi:hypothetical protein